MVEDEAVTRTAVTILLEQLGAQVFAVGTVQDGVQAIATNFRPDLVLCNLRLPDGNGVNVIKAVRQQDEQSGRHTPVIVLSGDTVAMGQSEPSEAALYQSIDYYLAKPFDSTTLVDRIRQLLEK